jgi:Xaa-Pro aminopeptidase
MEIARVDRVRELMAESKIDVLWVRSTDAFLNEYVPEDASTRVWLTGFTGSLGEALVTKNAAFLFVDGRYYLQADAEVDEKTFTVVCVPLGTSLEHAVTAKLREIETAKLRIGYEADRVPAHELERQKNAVNAEWVAVGVPSLVERARGEHVTSGHPLRWLDETKLDATSVQKIEQVATALSTRDVQGLLVQPLDEIAWLLNARGSDLPYQATFMARACLVGKRIVVGLTEAARTGARAGCEVVPLDRFDAELAPLIKGKRIGYDPKTTTAHALEALERAGATAVPVPSPMGPMKAKKGPRELKAMVLAFAKADKVVADAAAWLSTEVSKRKIVTEADFAEKVQALFMASGATGLSFKVISAAGRNGAHIHYSKPNKKRVIKQGELMLLDTGAYYAEGYATDLTRTFIVGPKNQKASAEQKRYYTLVLKAAIAGMRARLPIGVRGDQLDAITRAPLWAQGLDYNHGSGHGVGINVHEFPPRIGTTGTAALEEGMVFSIEPGVYLEKFGGVRIENLCTLERIKGVPGFLQVKPLTFSALDARLIERKLLNEEERAWLAQYMRGRAPK